MTQTEQTEYMGLAAAVGRLTMALKNTEAALEAVVAERDAAIEERNTLLVDATKKMETEEVA